MVRMSLVLVLLLAFAPDWLLAPLWFVLGVGVLVCWARDRNERERQEGVARYHRELARRRHAAARRSAQHATPTGA